jgi:hypothetical protein
VDRNEVNAVLAKMRALAHTITTSIGDDEAFRADAVAMAENFEMLDTHLSGCGAEPDAWTGWGA